MVYFIQIEHMLDETREKAMLKVLALVVLTMSAHQDSASCIVTYQGDDAAVLAAVRDAAVHLADVEGDDPVVLKNNPTEVVIRVTSCKEEN